jgi:hypothetical protein
LETEQSSSQRCGDPTGVRLCSLGNGPGPALIDRLDEEDVPTIEVLLLEVLDRVHLPVCGEDLTLVSGMSEEDPTPVVDELGDVARPIDFGHLGEDRSELIVEDDLSVEPDD